MIDDTEKREIFVDAAILMCRNDKIESKKSTAILLNEGEKTMLANIVSKIPIASRHQVTELDDKRKIASELLKHVDQLIKARDLQKALSETIHAKEIDPQNFYALALEERIQSLLIEKIRAPQQEQHTESRSKQVMREHQDCPKEILQKEIIHNINSISPSVVTQVPQEKIRTSPVIIQNSDEHREPILIPTLYTKGNNEDSTMKQKPKVVMIDDDVNFLSILSMTVDSGGFVSNFVEHVG